MEKINLFWVYMFRKIELFNIQNGEGSEEGSVGIRNVKF